MCIWFFCRSFSFSLARSHSPKTKKAVHARYDHVTRTLQLYKFYIYIFFFFISRNHCQPRFSPSLSLSVALSFGWFRDGLHTRARTALFLYGCKLCEVFFLPSVCVLFRWRFSWPCLSTVFFVSHAVKTASTWKEKEINLEHWQSPSPSSSSFTNEISLIVFPTHNECLCSVCIRSSEIFNFTENEVNTCLRKWQIQWQVFFSFVVSTE